LLRRSTHVVKTPFRTQVYTFIDEIPIDRVDVVDVVGVGVEECNLVEVEVKVEAQ